MRKRITLSVHGSSDEQITDLALNKLSHYLGCEPSQVESLCDIELDITGEGTSDSYSAMIIAKVKK